MCGAGRGARKKYRAGVGRWRKRVFRHPRLILVLVSLAPLRRAGYVLLHDLPDRQRADGTAGNLDHIVVCTAGVFLLDSKYLGGVASIHGDTVHVQRRDDDDESYDRTRLASGMRGRAVRLQQDIAPQTSVRFIQPVVVFWNPFPQGVVAGENVMFLHGERLVAWLRQQPEKMPENTVRDVARAIADARPPEHCSWPHATASIVLERLGRRTPTRGIADV